MTPSPITAIVYSPGASIDSLVRELAEHLRRRGVRMAGFIQLNEPRGHGPRCDMTLQELSSGQRLAISEYRGREARGCMLDVAELVRGCALASAALADHPDLLIVNKFGKIEAGGGGFCSVIAEAIDRGVPVLTTVPTANFEAWQAFAGEFAKTFWLVDLPRNAADLSLRLGLNEPVASDVCQIVA
jgi:nucleoside-triphosphatase THEP1